MMAVTAWATRYERRTGWSVPRMTYDVQGALALASLRPPDVDECPLIDVREAMGAVLLWRRHYLDIPVIATVLAEDETPIVALVGWEELVAGTPVALIDRIVGNPDRPPDVRAFNALSRRWSEVLRERGLTRTVAHVGTDRRDVQHLIERYGFTAYAGDDHWRWYLRDE